MGLSVPQGYSTPAEKQQIIIPFRDPLGESQASLLLWDWRLRMGQPQILSCFGAFLFLRCLPLCVSWGCVLSGCLGVTSDAARAGAERSIAGKDRVSGLHPQFRGGLGELDSHPEPCDWPHWVLWLKILRHKGPFLPLGSLAGHARRRLLRPACHAFPSPGE